MAGVIALWLSTLAAGYLGGRLYGRYTLRYGNEADRDSRGTYRLLAVVGFGSGFVLAFAGLVDATERALSSVHLALADAVDGATARTAARVERPA
ncbi:hypothetical protein [Natrinema salifodinae]|uniref:Uncharacterized protein n=1 Tax=Natrinema salifodinae TaxID=1202768 RepID=A0A1I0PJU6_9EURY|nr:hypothetical protein [Natrinema salifodinae]SEW14563.1 hypothetical protein SAMN05216285_2638 [Natrinema salifodinae]